MTIEEKIAQLKTDRSNAINSKVATIVAQADASTMDAFNDKFLWGDGFNNGIQQLYKMYLDEKNIEKGTTFSKPNLVDYTKTYWNNTEFPAAISNTGDGANGFYPSGASTQQMDYTAYWINTNGEAVGTAGLLTLTNALQAAIAAASGLWDIINKSALLTAITNLRNAIITGSSYRNNLSAIYTEVGLIKTASNPIYEEGGMSADIFDDRSNISTLQTNLDNAAGTSGTYNPTSHINSHLFGFNAYFTTIAAPGPPNPDPNSFTDITTLNNTIISYINTRYTYVDNNTLGAVYSSSPSDFTRLRKWRFFWINARIGKPSSSLINYTAMGSALTSIGLAITNADAQLDILLGSSNREQYIPTPTLFATFENHKRDENGLIIQRRVGLAYGGQQHATEYKILRRLTSAVAMNNTPWGDTPYATYSTINSDTTYVSNLYTDTDAGFAIGQKYCYRVRVRDLTNDTFVSGSVESKIYEDASPYSFTNIVSGQLTIPVGHKITAGVYVAIIGTSVDGFYFVSNVVNETITLSQSINYTGVGILYPANSVVFITE
jgi:hypothetical protein